VSRWPGDRCVGVAHAEAALFHQCNSKVIHDAGISRPRDFAIVPLATAARRGGFHQNAIVKLLSHGTRIVM